MAKKIFRKLAAAGLALSLAVPANFSAVAQTVAAQGSAKAAVTLDAVEVAPDQVRITLSDAAKYNSFVTANPPRLIVELLDTEYQLGAKSMAGKGKYLLRIRSGQYARSPRMVSRLVMDLAHPSRYRISGDKNTLTVFLTGPAEEEAAAKVSVPIQPKAAPEPAESVAGSFSTESSAELGAMAERLDVTKPAKAAPAETLAENNAVAAAPAAPAASRMPRGDILSRIPRDVVSLDFDNTDVKDIIKLLAAKSKVNIIHGNDVSGTLTLHLANVPFHEAFRTILTMMNLSTTQVGDNILRVLTPAELTRESASASGITKVIPLTYARATEIASSITTVRNAEGRLKGSTLVESNTNSIILTDTPEGIAASERLIAQIDIKPRQVMIEAKLIEVSLGNTFSVGIQWSLFETDKGKALGKQGVTTLGSQAIPTLTNAVTGRPYDQAAIPAAGGSAGLGAPSFGLSLPAANALGTLTLGRVTNNYILNAALTAAATNRKAKVLSDPKIATINNKAANINVTSSLPFTTTSFSANGAQQTTVSYAVIGIQLSVTPTINPDGTITLDITPDVTQPSANAASPVPGVPQTDKRSAHTVVMVKDQETIVIGGLIHDTVNNSVAKIPFLGDLPLIGWLFKQKTVTRDRNELLIFVTPRILD